MGMPGAVDRGASVPISSVSRAMPPAARIGGRSAQPEEVAHTALYLASPGAGMVNGVNLALDGGYTAI